MATDLFALFPDLPWPRIGHPPAQVWPQIELPPPPRPRSLFQDREHSKSPEAALAQIYEIALRERKRLTPRNRNARVLGQIIEIARASL